MFIHVWKKTERKLQLFFIVKKNLTHPNENTIFLWCLLLKQNFLIYSFLYFTVLYPFFLRFVVVTFIIFHKEKKKILTLFFCPATTYSRYTLTIKDNIMSINNNKNNENEHISTQLLLCHAIIRHKRIYAYRTLTRLD